MHLKTLFVYLFTLFFCLNIFAQKTKTITYTVAEMQNDFNYLHSQIKLNHPGFYRYTSKEKWDSIYKAVLGKLSKPMRDVEYRVVIRNYVSNIQCGHTQVFPSKESIKKFEKQKHTYPPFNVAFVNSKLIVTLNESNDSNLKIGTEIKSINGHTASEIIEKTTSVQSADANLNSMKMYYGAIYFRTFYNAFFGEDSVFELSCININKDTQTFVVKQKEKPKEKIKLPKLKKDILHQPFADFRITSGDTQSAILKIKGFRINNASKMYERIFNQLDDERIKYLIIDLRGNGGGSINDAAELIAHLSKDTFSYSFASGKQGLTYHKNADGKLMFYFSRTILNLFVNRKETENQYRYYFGYNHSNLKKLKKFDGAIFCLIDNGSFSAASFVAAYLKNKCNAILVGQETAGTESGCYAVNTPLLILPQTKNFIRIPHYQFKHHMPFNDTNRGVLPNIETPITAETISSEKDEEMDLIWKIILEK